MAIVNEYNDETFMPFGQHKGIKLANVPAEYLLYLWNVSREGTTLSDAKLAKYISIEVLRMEVLSEKQKRKFERQ